MPSLLCEAIRSRRLLSFKYGGGNRVVEPYSHGIRQGGPESVRAYQVSGFSASGERTGWKFFEVGRMSQLEIMPETFDLRDDADRARVELKIIHCDVWLELS